MKSTEGLRKQLFSIAAEEIEKNEKHRTLDEAIILYFGTTLLMI
jgi:hypothetical protein